MIFVNESSLVFLHNNSEILKGKNCLCVKNRTRVLTEAFYYELANL